MTALNNRSREYNPRPMLRRCKYCKRSAYEVDGWLEDDVCIHCEPVHLKERLSSIEENLHELERYEAFGGRLDRYQSKKLESLSIEQKYLIQRIDQIEGVNYAN